jgi:hypothetical protein
MVINCNINQSCQKRNRNSSYFLGRPFAIFTIQEYKKIIALALKKMQR